MKEQYVLFVDSKTSNWEILSESEFPVGEHVIISRHDTMYEAIKAWYDGWYRDLPSIHARRK